MTCGFGKGIPEGCPDEGPSFGEPKFNAIGQSDSPNPVRHVEWDVPQSVTVGTSEVLLARESKNRTLVYIQNTSSGTQKITVVFKNRTKMAATIVSGVGFVIPPGGWRVWDECGECAVSGEEIRVIGDAASGSVVIMEGKRISAE